MATLTSNITSSAGQIAVSGDVSGARTKVDYRIDDEVVTLRKFVRELDGVANPWGQLNRSKWVVSRGMLGTTAASHLSGAAIVAVGEDVAVSASLVPPSPFDAGGSISATDGTTTVDPATSINFPAGTVSDEGGGVAGILGSRLLGIYGFSAPGTNDGVERKATFTVTQDPAGMFSAGQPDRLTPPDLVSGAQTILVSLKASTSIQPVSLATRVYLSAGGIQSGYAPAPEVAAGIRYTMVDVFTNGDYIEISQTVDNSESEAAALLGTIIVVRLQ